MLPYRIAQPVRDTLATQYATTVGTSSAAVALCNATADNLRMRRRRLRPMLRKAAYVASIAAPPLVTSALAGPNGAILNAGTDSNTGTVATVTTPLTYTFTSGGNILLIMQDIVLGSLTNCTATVGQVWTQVSPVINADGTTATITQANDGQQHNINAGGTCSFILNVTPTAAGAWSLIVSLGSNDLGKNPFHWTVNGTAAVNAGAMAVLVGAAPLANAGTDTIVGATHAVLGTETYTINNTGGVALTLTNPVTLAALVNCTVTVATPPTSPVAAFVGTTSLVLNITPTIAAPFSFTVSVANGDPTKNPYHWSVAGVAA